MVSCSDDTLGSFLAPVAGTGRLTPENCRMCHHRWLGVHIGRLVTVSILLPGAVWSEFAVQMLTLVSDTPNLPFQWRTGALSNTVSLLATRVCLSGGISFRPLALARV